MEICSGNNVPSSQSSLKEAHVHWRGTSAPSKDVQMSRFDALAALAILSTAPLTNARAMPVAAADLPRLVHIVDETRGFFIDRYNEEQFDKVLKWVQEETGADIRLMFTMDIPGDIETYSLKRARQLGVGRETGGRGMLIVYDLSGGRVRFEVGPALQDVFTDSFVGYMMRQSGATFFATGSRVVGLKATVYVVTQRLREALLSTPINARALSYVMDSTRLASGGGATARVKMADERPFYRPGKPPPEVLARFGPQPSVVKTYEKYLEAMGSGILSPDLPLYVNDPHEVKKVLMRVLATPIYKGFMYLSEAGQTYRIVERGDLAILYYTSTPLAPPHFFRHSPTGWQADLAAEHRDIGERVGGSYAWEMTLSGDDYSAAFSDLYRKYRGYLRLADGDNRPTPKPKLANLAGR